MEIKIDLNISESEKLKIGEKLIRDLISNLAMIGFSKEKSVKLLLSHLDSSEEFDDLEDDSDESDEDDDEQNTLWAIEEKADENNFAVALRRHQKRVAATNVDSDEKLNDTDLLRLIDAINCLDDAYKWYKKECSALGVDLAISRDAWIIEATDEMLDKEDGVLFFEETNVFNNACLHQIGQFANLAAQCGRLEYIEAIEVCLEKIEIQLPSEYALSLTKGRANILNRNRFMDRILSFESNLELPRSVIISETLIESSKGVPEWMILDWIDELERSGKLLTFKKEIGGRLNFCSAVTV